MREIVFILDRSYSMHGLEGDVIGGFNKLLEDQKKEKGKAKVTVILFDDEYEVLLDGVDLRKVKPITHKEYFVRGNTALLDAVGRTIRTIDARVEEKDKVLFIINTDGEENSSKEFTNADIEQMVTHLQNEHDWKFVFLGANIDSFSIAGDMGIAFAANYTANSNGVQNLFASVSNVTRSWRASNTGDVDEEELKTIQ